MSGTRRPEVRAAIRRLRSLAPAPSIEVAIASATLPMVVLYRNATRTVTSIAIEHPASPGTRDDPTPPQLVVVMLDGDQHPATFTMPLPIARAAWSYEKKKAPCLA